MVRSSRAFPTCTLPVSPRRTPSGRFSVSHSVRGSRRGESPAHSRKGGERDSWVDSPHDIERPSVHSLTACLTRLLSLCLASRHGATRAPESFPSETCFLAKREFRDCPGSCTSENSAE